MARKAAEKKTVPEVDVKSEKARALEQTLSALEKEFGEGRIAVGCIFGKEDNLSLPQDVNLASECQIKKELNKKKYRVIIADPFMEQLLSEDSETKFYANAQYAVSSKVCVEQMPRMIGEKFNAWYTAC